MRRVNKNVLRILQNDDLQSLEILTGSFYQAFYKCNDKNIDKFIFLQCIVKKN